MTLKDYLTQTNIGVNEFARRSRRKKWLRAADLVQAMAAKEEE